MRVNATTVRAFIVSPQRPPLRRQGTVAFTITGGGSIAAQSAPDNSAVAVTGHATMDLTVTAMTRAESEHLLVHVELCGQRQGRLERRLARMERVLYAVVAAVLASGGINSTKFIHLVEMVAELGRR